MELKEFERISKRVKEAQTNKAKAEGALGTIKNRLKEEFGVTSFKEAQTLLTKMEKSIDADELQLQTDLAEFEKKWQDVEDS